MSQSEQPGGPRIAPFAGRLTLVGALRRSRPAKLGLMLVGLFLAGALLAPVVTRVAHTDPLEKAFERRLLPPASSFAGLRHWLGTDDLGRDLGARIVYGARNSLAIALFAVSLGLVFGVLIGSAAGYQGGYLDQVLMRFMDLFLAFPSFLLAIAIVAALGPSLRNAMIAVGIVSIPVYARLVRASVMATAELEYVQASRAVGAGEWQILFGTVLPNCLAPLLVQTTMSMGTAILDAAGLSFLGLGAQPPTPEWGAMLAASKGYLTEAPWVGALPGLCILLTVLGFNLLGDGLRDALDPRLRFAARPAETATQQLPARKPTQSSSPPAAAQ